MSFLLLFIVIPVLTVIGIFFSKTHMQVKWTAVIGMSIQLILAGVLIYLFLAARAAGNTAEILFSQDMV